MSALRLLRAVIDRFAGPVLVAAIGLTILLAGTFDNAPEVGAAIVWVAVGTLIDLRLPGARKEDA